MTSVKLILLTASICGLAIASAEELPRYYDMTDPGFSEAFRIEASADFRASLDTEGNFDIGVGEVRSEAYDAVQFTHPQLVRFWQTQAKGKFVCLILGKNTLEKAERSRYLRKIADDLFACGIRRVRIHQGYGAGVEVIFDETRIQPEQKK